MFQLAIRTLARSNRVSERASERYVRWQFMDSGGHDSLFVSCNVYQETKMSSPA
jgi:hypothetical protein